MISELMGGRGLGEVLSLVFLNVEFTFTVAA